MKRLAIQLLQTFLLISCTEKEESLKDEKDKTPHLNYTILGSFPHDTNSFTEGFFMKKGKIYESTGSPQDLPLTQTHFGILDTTSGKINVKASLDKAKYFGEGISILDGKLYQLTYKSKTCFVYDATSFKLLESIKYPNAEGWGLTNDGTNLIMSDGTYKITFVSPVDFIKVREINVKENGYAIDKINELEYVDGFIYANVWMTNTILKIDAKNGRVMAKGDFESVYQNAKNNYPDLLEMNGIAYDQEQRQFLLTGKLWPKVYRVKFE